MLYRLINLSEFVFHPTTSTFFDVLLTVHLSIFISVFNQLYAQNLVSSGIITPTPVGVMIPEVV